MQDSSTCGAAGGFQEWRMVTIHKPFKYVPAQQTDIRATFKRELARLKALEEQRRGAAGNVTPIAQTKVRSA
jgi:hypothetical protein